MPDALLDADHAATPLTPDERDGLIPNYITLRSELNEAEQLGVLAADAWAFARRRPVLDEKFLRNLHKRMFGAVWRWAGHYRRSDRNLGVEAYRIPANMALLLDEARYWTGHDTYPPDEIAARLHHRLVLIHCYPNGNGRHARLAADLLLARLGLPRFSWGIANLTAPGEARRTYIGALRAADGQDYAPLLAFVRS